MKKTMLVFAVVFGLSMVLNSAPGMAMGKKPHSYPGVRTISMQELSQKLQNGEPVQIVNVLGPDNYDLGMIKGSLKIPLKELDQRLNELDKTKDVVTYCANYKCSASDAAADKLQKLGYNVRAYKGGIKEWKEAGLPVE